MLSKQTLISIDDALPGREQAMQIEDKHFVNHASLTEPLQPHQQQVLLGMGCFWGAERLFWQLEGVVSTSVGYSGGYTKTQLMTKSAREKPAMRKSSEPSSMSVLFRCNSCWLCSGKSTTQPKVCVKATILVHSIARLSTHTRKSNRTSLSNQNISINKPCKKSRDRLSQRKYNQRVRTILQKPTTSNISPRTLTDTVASEEQEFVSHQACKNKACKNRVNTTRAT